MYPSGTDFPYIGHMAAPNDFGSKYDRKIDQNLPNLFPKKKNVKWVQTKFHQNRLNKTDFCLKIARHEIFTPSENGSNSK